MCGIVGIYHLDHDRPVERHLLERMADRIVHRGPDDAGFHVDGNMGMGMRRLSVIDVAGGHQPIFTRDGRYAIVFNGEVYNYREERARLEREGFEFRTNSDTEVVLNLFARHGVEFTDHLNGMFAVAIWDRVLRQLVVARDRIGIKPLYYWHDGATVLFASEIKALLALPYVTATLDREGFSTYLRYGFTPAPYTLFKGIRKLPPAYLLKIGESGIQETEYWRLSYADKSTAKEDDLKEELHDLLEDSVCKQMVADVPIGAFLSGGLDSSGIVHLMSRAARAPVNTYSVGFGKGYEAHNELDAARRFASDYGTNHHEIVVQPNAAELLPTLVPALDEPVADSSFILTYLVAKLARESSTVILSGVGGDELFGGYRRYLNAALSRALRIVPQPVRSHAILPFLRLIPSDRNGFVSNLARLAKSYLAAADLPVSEQYGHYVQVFDSDFLRALTAASADTPDFFAKYTAECDSDELLDRLMYFDLKMSLPEQLLMLTDKMTMAVSLEGRVPLLDHRIVEFAARIPARLKVNGFDLRHLQKRAFEGRLPSYVFKQRKKGFGAPIGSWLRKDLAPLLDHHLGRARLEEQGIFSPEAVDDLIGRHHSRTDDNTDQLLALLAFQFWYSSYGLS